VPLLTRLQDPLEAHLLREALAAEGIAAEVRDEFSPVMAGGVSVWVADEADLPAARAVLEEFRTGGGEA
jgi:Putative prokaryotic signal transducing protein